MAAFIWHITLPMLENAYLLFGLAAAVLYAIGASFLKVAGERGVTSLQATLVTNTSLALLFMWFVPWHDSPFPATWWPSIALGALFAVGQFFTMLAIARGCPSISTPVLGTKVVLVALMVTFAVGTPLKTSTWMAAMLTTVGIGILAMSASHMSGQGRLAAFAYALGAAGAFGAFDVMTQYWSPRLGFGRFMPWGTLIGAGMTACVIAVKERGFSGIPRPAWGSMALATALNVGQSLLLIWAIGRFADAAGLNVVYGSRGIWSVLVVWLLGAYLGAKERITGARMLVQRLCGATVIAAAIVLAFWQK